MDIKIKNVLAYLGVIPFLSLSIFILNEYKFNDGILISSIKSYGLVILSFLSGVYWGQHLSLKEKFSIF